MPVMEKTKTVTPTVTIEQIDTDTAIEYLTHNTHNRPFRPSVARALTQNMLDDEWFPTSQIIFDVNGVLIDGQHRLQAVIDSGTVQTFVVLRGAPPEAQDTIDTQSRRTTGDQLQLAGETNYVVLAAVTRLCARFLAGARGMPMFSRNEFGGRPKGFPNTAQTKAFIAEHPEIRTAVAIAFAGRRQINLPASIAGYLAWAGLQVTSEAEVRQFFELLYSGADLARDNPIYIVRERLLQQDPRVIRHPHIIAADLIKAWNLWRTDAPASPNKVRWRSTGPQVEKYPEAK